MTQIAPMDGFNSSYGAGEATPFGVSSPAAGWSADGERPPLNNLLNAPRAPELPNHFPGFDSPSPSLVPQSAPAEPSGAAADLVRPTLGAPQLSGLSPGSAQQPVGRMTPISTTQPGPQPAAASVAAATNFAAAPQSPSAELPTKPRRFTPVKRHVVQDGDTLTSLAKRYYGDDGLASALYEANRGVLATPDLLPIGAVLTIPARETTPPAAAAGEPAAPLTTPAAKLIPKLEINAYGAPPPGSTP
ncbi:MAG: LysM domain-containing protein [Pirellulales bacterium]